jgi:hypothetical protein
MPYCAIKWLVNWLKFGCRFILTVKFYFEIWLMPFWLVGFLSAMYVDTLKLKNNYPNIFWNGVSSLLSKPFSKIPGGRVGQKN